MDCRLCDLSHPPTHPAVTIKHLSPNTPIIMMSAFCRMPCRRMVNADVCIEKGEDGRHLLHVLELMSHARHYGLCRGVPA